VNVSTAIQRACADVPGLVRAVLVLLPDGFHLGSVGADRVLDLEPMIRAAARCLAARPVPAIRDDGAAPFVEYVLVFDDEVIVVESGRRDPRLALVVACDREPNLALVQQACRVAIAAIEDTVDLAAWGMAS
jgi:hypothetical protein